MPSLQAMVLLELEVGARCALRVGCAVRVGSGPKWWRSNDIYIYDNRVRYGTIPINKDRNRYDLYI